MATEVEGPILYSYDLTTETPIDIDELIYVNSPQDLPLLTGYGSDGLAVLPRIGTTDKTFNWMEVDIPTPRGVIAEALDDSETAIDMTAGTGVNFVIGDIVRIDDECMAITDINLTTSPETLTVTRGALGTTPAAHSNGAEILGLGTALAEGEIGSGNFLGRDKFTNYTQIFSGKVEMSGTEQVIRKYGVPNELNLQILNRVFHHSVGIEQAALYGLKTNDSSTRIRSTGGLHYFIDDNIDSSSDWLTVDNIESRQLVTYDAGGSIEMIMAQPRNFAALNNVTGSERVQTVTIDDPRRGRATAQMVMTEYGPVTLVRNRWCRKADAFGYNRENFVMRVLRPFHMTRLAKTKDTDSFMILTELGFEVKGQGHMAMWTSLDATAAMPTDLV